MQADGTVASERQPNQRKLEPSLGSRLKTWFSRLRERAPFNWPTKRKRRWLLAIVLAALAYPVLVSVALWTGLVERLLKSEDLRVEIQNPAYTIWPGRIQMKHVRILTNGTTQFILEGDNIVINVRLLELLTHRVHVSELAAQNVLYQMRVQVKDTKGIEKRVAAYPPLKDLPGAKVIHEEPAKQREESESDWTVEVDGLNVAVRELWFFEYRYLGSGRLRGGFTVGPDVMEVTTAVQDLGPGELRFGPEQTVAKNLRGQITANIPRLNPKEHADASFMELVDARVNLRADVHSLANLGAYAEGTEISRGEGPLALDLYLDKGRLGSKSHLEYETKTLRVKGNGFGVGSDLQLKFDSAGSDEQLPLLRTAAKSTYVSLARGMRSFTIQLHDHHEEARLDTIQLSRSTDLKSASLRMPSIVSVDLRDLPVLLPEDAPVAVRSGEARGSLSLDLDKDYWAQGPLRLTLEDLKLDAAGVEMGGDLELKTQVRFNPKQKINQAQNMAFTLRDAEMRAGNRSVDGWWMNLDSKRLTFWASEPPRFAGSLSVRARDLEPVLEALAEKEVISKLIPLFTSLSDFRAGATIRAAGPITDVALASESDVWDFAGRIYKDKERSRMALVVGGQTVSLGVASDGDGLELMPFAKTEWLNEQLRKFPKPLIEMRGKKP